MAHAIDIEADARPFLFPLHFPAFDVNVAGLIVLTHLAQHFFELDVRLPVIRLKAAAAVTLAK
jgi:hypothetical protein